MTLDEETSTYTHVGGSTQIILIKFIIIYTHALYISILCCARRAFTKEPVCRMIIIVAAVVSVDVAAVDAAPSKPAFSSYRFIQIIIYSILLRLYISVLYKSFLEVR